MKEISMLLCLNIILIGKKQKKLHPAMVGRMLLKMLFGKMATEYYTLSEFVTEFNTWIRSDTKADLWNAIAKTAKRNNSC